MNLTLIPTPEFSKSVKKLFKKYRLISQDLKQMEALLSSGEDSSIDLGNDCYKMRLPNSSIPTGKSGGFRVIYYKKVEETIYLLTIYSKSDIENIEDEHLDKILKNNELK